MVMRKVDGPITEDVILQYLTEDIALYSIYMPAGVTTASITVTREVAGSVETYDELIELDDVAEACTNYLIRSGCPVFDDARAQDAYRKALEHQLRQGVVPQAARDTALLTYK